MSEQYYRNIEIARRVLEGESYAQLAQKFGVSSVRCRQIAAHTFRKADPKFYANAKKETKFMTRDFIKKNKERLKQSLNSLCP
jgi:DNA-directed RNA polymerase sigma subunit (sigma70/sigma32)